MTKEELIKEIQDEISLIENKRIRVSDSTETTDAINRVAISNLYIALSNLIK